MRLLLILVFHLIVELSFGQSDTIEFKRKIGHRTITKSYFEKELIKKHVYKFVNRGKDFNPNKINSKIKSKEFNSNGRLIKKTILKPVSSKPKKRVDITITRNSKGQRLKKEKIVRKKGIPIRIIEDKIYRRARVD